ncbi:hypothetical protein ATY79_10835 [Rhizobium sp. R693]|nr:hypothetical protein ATY79_10835 [Rhizobium sp. R693]
MAGAPASRNCRFEYRNAPGDSDMRRWGETGLLTARPDLGDNGSEWRCFERQPLLVQCRVDDFLDRFRQPLAPIDGARQQGGHRSLRAVTGEKVIDLSRRQAQVGCRTCDRSLLQVAVLEDLNQYAGDATRFRPLFVRSRARRY